MLHQSAAMAEFQKALSAKGLEVQSIPGKGRGLVTTRDFSLGEVVICEEPYVSAPKVDLGGPICDGCFATDSLRRCSACRVAWYCGSMCQKSEWKLHKLECRALVRLPEDQREMLSIASTLRLVMRLLLKRRLQDEQVIPTTPTDNYELVDAMVSHMSDNDENKRKLNAAMAELIDLVLSPDIIVDIKETRQIFSKVNFNAHQIYHGELRDLGSGIYPLLSFVNHSCASNALVVFEGRVAFARAMEPIAKGTEVSIGYVDTAATTDMRQKALKPLLFSCKCSRCVAGLEEDAILGGFRCKDKRCNGFLLQDSGKKHFTCQQCGLVREQQEIEKIAHEVQEMLKTASALLSSGNYHDAIVMYKNIEHLQLKICHSFSMSLYKTREALLQIMMEQEDWSSALMYCRLTMPYYHNIYSKFNPTIGFHYCTCGNLEWSLGLFEDAGKSYTKAMEILRITHGSNMPFMKELQSKLDKARLMKELQSKLDKARLKVAHQNSSHKDHV